MKRLLLVTDIFPPEIGGPATFISELALECSQKGYVVTVVCMSDESLHPSDDARPYLVKRHWRKAPDIHRKVIATLIDEMWRADEVFVNGLEYFAACASHHTKKAYTLKIVGDYVWEGGRNTERTSLSIDEFQKSSLSDPWLQERVREREAYLSGAEHIVVPSNYLKSLVCSWGVPSEKVQVIYNGVRQRISERALTTRVSPVMSVVFCGRLVSWKGVDTLFHAVATLPRVRVSIVGDGPSRASLHRLSEELGIDDRVIFYGVLEGEALRRVLVSHEVLVLGSQYEGLSHTLIEGGALGLCRVASSSGGNPELIDHGIDGLLFPYGDVEALKSHLEQLGSDDTLRIRLAERGRERCSKLNITRTVEKTIDCITSLRRLQSRPKSMSFSSVTHVINLGDYPGFAPLSGAENHLFLLMEELRKRGLNVELIPLITAPGPRLLEALEGLKRKGILVTPITYSPQSHGRCDRAAIRALRTLFGTRREHVIHTHLEMADCDARIAASLAGCKAIVNSIHNNEPFYVEPLWQRQLNILDNFNQRTIAISEAVRDHLVHGVGLPIEKISVIRYGVPHRDIVIESRESLRQEFEIPSEKPVIGFVGRLQPQKNIPLLLAALKQAPEYHGVIVGGGQLDEFQQIARNNDIHNVQFLGYVPDASRLISAFDVFCLPSLWEGLGLVLLEAMQRQIPIIGSTAGAIPEILHYGMMGHLFSPQSPDELLTAVRRILMNHGETSAMVMRAKDYSKVAFPLKRMIDETLNVYEKVVDEGA
jgi:glycosyltransferase involved in cell wall biosynthesis